jgi:hypothetical protein
MENGKCLVEVLSKVCHGCQRIVLESYRETKACWKVQNESHGPSASMETEDVKRIFQRSENDCPDGPDN